MTEHVAPVTETVAQNPAQPVSTPAVVAPPRTYTDEDVDRVKVATKHKYYDKGYEDARTEFATKQTQVAPAQETISLEKLKETARAEAKKEYEEQQNQVRTQQFISQFSAKMESGKQKYSDFEQKVTSLQLQTMPEVLQLANAFDNTSDIMYDLAENPTKVAFLSVLATTKPHLAVQEMQKLSQTIRKNETEKANQPKVKEPLSQIKPSNIGMDNGSQSVRDFKNQDWLRG